MWMQNKIKLSGRNLGWLLNPGGCLIQGLLEQVRLYGEVASYESVLNDTWFDLLILGDTL